MTYSSLAPKIIGLIKIQQQQQQKGQEKPKITHIFICVMGLSYYGEAIANRTMNIVSNTEKKSLLA